MEVLKVCNCEYNPRRFAACVLWIREPKATAMVFASGKIVGIKFEEYKIVNVVASTGIKSQPPQGHPACSVLHADAYVNFNELVTNLFKQYKASVCVVACGDVVGLEVRVMH
ncbi:hypothetical protein EJ04DRAFT_576430 [Polyplosphaeria fusca]|uniref:Uncharacterized protein n=1 Tax=Polyplosphaeria fusca TaxID=682080 RepID=A0A9P4R1E7_9PLEO|nr:hypothetical protein EJ04DRAFT_576430 [Polyplosphaeria fusca]